MAVKNAVSSNWTLDTQLDGRKYSRDDVTPPFAPGSPTATVSGTSPASEIDLSCAAATDANSAVIEYRYYRSLTETGTYSFIGTLNLATRTATDQNLAQLTTYWYKFTAVNAFGLESALSAADDATTTSPGEDFGFPVLFDDLSGRPFAGEPGALVVNDEATVYEYQPRFAPVIPTIPTYAAAGHQTIVTTRAELITALDAGGSTPTYRHIFVQKGADMHGLGDISITNAGTESLPRWILYYDPDDVGKDLTTFQPWNLAIGHADRTQMCRLNFTTGSAYYYIVGLNWGESGNQLTLTNAQILADAATPGTNWPVGQKQALHDGDAHDIVWYRCSAENSQNGHAWNVNSANCENITAYQCVSFNHLIGTGDILCFQTISGANVRIISCEGHDFLGDFCMWESGAGNIDGVVEDCDMYQTRFTDNDGTLNTNGDYHVGEGGIDLKRFVSVRCYGNRIWAMRETANLGPHGAGSGSPIRFSNNNADKVQADIRWNIIDDSTDGGILVQGATSTGVINGRHSVVRNIVNNVRPTGGNQPINVKDHNTEVYLNTVSNCSTASASIGYATPQGGAITADVRGNLLMTVPAMLGTGNLSATSTVGYNAYLGTAPVFNKGLAGTDQTSSIAAANMANFTYKRKKLTAPENATINSIVPTTVTPSAIRTMVPVTGVIGTVTGVGVDDVS